MLSARVANGSARLSRVAPRRTRSGRRATVFAVSRVSVSRRSAGRISTDSSSAPAATVRQMRANHFRRSSAVFFSSAWRTAVSLMPSNAKTVVSSASPSASSEPSDSTRSRFRSTDVTGDVLSASPSGRATRYDLSERYAGRRSFVDSSVGSIRTYPPSAATATMAWLK